MTTTTARQPAGTPVGGQFAPGSKAAPDAGVTLAEPTWRPSDRAASVDRLMTTTRSGNVQLEQQIRAQMAEGVRENFPHVAEFTLGWDNDYKCLETLSITDADGHDVDDEDSVIRDYIDGELSLQAGVLVELEDNVRCDFMRRDKHRFVVADEAARPPLPIGGSRAAAVYTAEQALEQTIDHDEDDSFRVRYAVRDLLTDLHHFAAAKGLNLNDLFERAREVAAEEDGLWGDDA